MKVDIADSLTEVQRNRAHTIKFLCTSKLFSCFEEASFT